VRPEPIRQVIYSSKASGQMPSEELASILRVAKRNNEIGQITGILLFRRGQFLQLLEGTETNLNAVLSRIARDPRHRDITTIMNEPAKARAFGAWSMGFQDISNLDANELPGFSAFLNNGFSSTECVRYPSKALKLLLAFREE
jgi:hypothetical protein